MRIFRSPRWKNARGLIALTGGPGGPIDRALRAGLGDLAESRLKRLAQVFGSRLYVEIQRHGLDSERAIEPDLIALADRVGLPLVATNEPYFAGPSDYEAHDALLCVAEGAVVSMSDRRRLSPEHRFKTRAEMTELFADLPEATEASVEIAMRCAYRPLTRKPILPRFSVAGGAPLDEEHELRRQASEGLSARLAAHGLTPGRTEEDYSKRLAFELDVIVNMKFAGYFLIVADFIQWAKAQGIPVGPGRGSGAGSVVAWALTITDLDPLEVWPPVRAVPQSRTHLDARFRHRLLPGPPRRSDRLRARALWRRPRGADHHLRLVPGARRPAQRRPGA